MNQARPNSFRSGPDEHGHFGIFGGRFVAETLMPLILELEKAYNAAKADPAFQAEMNGHLRDYVGRPSPLYFAERLTEHLREVSAASGRAGGAKIYFKREELNHTGSHKVNNVLGQIMLARRMGKKRIIAETGAGQHGVATATLCARFGLECVVYMGAVDVARQQPNVIRMEMLGAKVFPVQSGTRTLKDAMNEALRDWVTNVHNTFYCIGTVAGPHPYPTLVRDFQSIIGNETRKQMQEAEGRLPDSLIACIGGGSNAMGLFHPFLDDPSVEIFGVEAAGHGLTQLHAASIAGGRPGVLHGNRTYLLMNEDGQIQDAHSISAGLDYPGIGPEHSWLHEVGRVGKKRIIAETGAGQHGVATATLCARFGLECVVYMGAVDVARQQPNVIRMEMLGAKVFPVQSGTRTLKDAMNEALRDWVTNVHNTFYCIGTVAGPHPYPTLVRDFQSIIGNETKKQMQEAEGRLPDSLVACIGGGSNAMGLFHPFLDDPSVEIFGVEAAGHGLTQLHAASIAGGRPGVLHGNRTYLADERGRPDPGRAFDLGGAGLSRHRPGAFLAA